MRMHKIIVGALTCALTLGAALPAMAGISIVIHKPKPDPVVQRPWDRDADDERFFNDWYGAASRSFNDIDPETGERIGDLLQVVTEVSNTRLMVTDSQRTKRAVFMSPKTQVSFPEVKRYTRVVGCGLISPRKGRDFSDYIKVGDLVVVQGYLRNNGGVFASHVRVYGQATTWDGGRTQPSYDGIRLWGTIRGIDGRLGTIDVDTNVGQRRVALDRRGEVLIGSKAAGFKDLRIGDRVVLYAGADSRTTLCASRIVVLGQADRFPEADRPCPADPRYQPEPRQPETVPAPGNLPVLDGYFVEVQPTFLFDRLIVRDRQGNETVFRVAKETKLLDRAGRTIDLRDLRPGDRLRVKYELVGDTRFARDVDLI